MLLMHPSCECCCDNSIHIHIYLVNAYILVFSSYYSSERFADIPIPPTEDWEAATGEVLLNYVS
jgi:hypothetical protein